MLKPLIQQALDQVIVSFDDDWKDSLVKQQVAILDTAEEKGIEIDMPCASSCPRAFDKWLTQELGD
jgi:hypothetical protein